MLEALFVGATDLLFAYLVFRIPSVYSVRTLFFKTCQHKSWRSQEFVEKGRLKVGPTKRRGAYAAMLVLSVPSVRTHCFLSLERTKTGVSRRRKKKERLRRDALVQKRIAPSRKEKALTPRCLSAPCSLCSLCETLFFKACQHKSWRSQGPTTLKFGVPRKPFEMRRSNKRAPPVAALSRYLLRPKDL